MATFHPVPGLNELVAVMVAPDVRDIAKRVELTAKRLAPAAKVWVTMGDDRVRDTHVGAGTHPAIASNLRFKVRGQPWDIAHGLSPGVDYLLAPRDTSTGLPADSVQHVHCRCHAALRPNAIRDAIVTGPAEVLGPHVRVVVSCTWYQVVQAEYGDTYPGGITAQGTHFMGRAAARVAGNAGGFRPTGPQGITGNPIRGAGQGDDAGG